MLALQLKVLANKLVRYPLTTCFQETLHSTSYKTLIQNLSVPPTQISCNHASFMSPFVSEF